MALGTSLTSIIFTSISSMVHQVLVEESVLGWEELELEVVRDSKNQMITATNYLKIFLRKLSSGYKIIFSIK
jgi:carbamoylphosphate synthase large subunit